MADLNLPYTLFSYDPSDMTFVAEASDLKTDGEKCGYYHGHLQRRPHPLGGGEVNVGFFLRGRTARVWFSLIRYERDREGDLLYSMFIGALDGKIYYCKVFND